MNYAFKLKQAALVLASVMLLSTVLAGCSGSTVTPSADGSTFHGTSEISLPSADSLGENGELLQCADVTLEEVLADGFAVQEESVALDRAGLPAKIVTSAYLSGEVFDATNAAASAKSDKLGSEQASVFLAALQANFPVVASVSLASDSQSVFPVTLTYEYGNVSTIAKTDPYYVLRNPSTGQLGKNDGVLLSFTLSFSADNTETDTALADDAEPADATESGFWITYTTHADDVLNPAGEWTSSDSDLLRRLDECDLGDTVLAMGNAALADVADLVAKYGYSVGELTDENMYPTVTASSLDTASPWVITKAWHAKDTETSLSTPATPARSSGPFVFMDSKKVRSSDSTTLISLTRTLRVWLANGKAAQVELQYTYRSGKLYSVAVTAERSEDASFGMYAYNGGADLFVVNASGDLVRSKVSSTISSNVQNTTTGGALSGDTVYLNTDTPVYTIYWTALLGKSSPGDADIIDYLRQSESEALQGLQNADAFIEKVHPSS